MEKLVRAIPVRDANGEQLALHEYRELRSVFAYARKVGDLRLCTGEPVRLDRRNRFVVSGTGERLTRVR